MGVGGGSKVNQLTELTNKAHTALGLPIISFVYKYI